MARTIDHPALQPLKAQFPEHTFFVGEFRGMVTVVVPREAIVEVCAFLRDKPALKFDMLFELNCVDYLNFPGTRHRFAVHYGVSSVDFNRRLWLKVYLDPEHDTAPGSRWNELRDEDVVNAGDPGLKLPSVTGVWPGAEWMEREIYDMYGIIPTGHPDLRRILTWNGFNNYPLRKDYPLRGVGERERYKIITREGA